jgi:hypothetical protein
MQRYRDVLLFEPRAGEATAPPIEGADEVLGERLFGRHRDVALAVRLLDLEAVAAGVERAGHLQVADQVVEAAARQDSDRRPLRLGEAQQRGARALGDLDHVGMGNDVGERAVEITAEGEEGGGGDTLGDGVEMQPQRLESRHEESSSDLERASAGADSARASRGRATASPQDAPPVNRVSGASNGIGGRFDVC